jgi:hypothetical protein
LDIGAPVGAVSVGFNRGVGGSDAGGVFGDVGKISGLGVGLDISNKYVYRGSNPN